MDTVQTLARLKEEATSSNRPSSSPLPFFPQASYSGILISMGSRSSGFWGRPANGYISGKWGRERKRRGLAQCIVPWAPSLQDQHGLAHPLTSFQLRLTPQSPVFVTPSLSLPSVPGMCSEVTTDSIPSSSGVCLYFAQLHLSFGSGISEHF